MVGAVVLVVVTCVVGSVVVVVVACVVGSIVGVVREAVAVSDVTGTVCNVVGPSKGVGTVVEFSACASKERGTAADTIPDSDPDATQIRRNARITVIL